MRENLHRRRIDLLVLLLYDSDGDGDYPSDYVPRCHLKDFTTVGVVLSLDTSPGGRGGRSQNRNARSSGSGGGSDGSSRCGGGNDGSGSGSLELPQLGRTGFVLLPFGGKNLEEVKRIFVV
jgi:hypothetical protein